MIHENAKKLLIVPLCLIILACSTAARLKKEETRVFSVDTETLMKDLKFLSSDELKGRETGTPESKVARDFIEKRFRESGVAPFGESYLQEFSFETKKKVKYEGVNVTGFIKGTQNPDRYIVISAHYDHVGVNNGEIYNGADDNASGVAALLAVARHFSSDAPANSLIFVAFDAEEKGLNGAKYFVKKPPVPISNILVNINMDMVSRSDKNELYVAGTYHYPEFAPLLVKTAKDVPVKLLFGHDRPGDKSDDWTNQSDHAEFHKKKIPFVYFGVEDHADYHKPTDDFEKVDKKFFTDSVKTILIATAAIDKSFESKE